MSVDDSSQYDLPPARGRPIRAPHSHGDLVAAVTLLSTLLGAAVLVFCRVTVFVDGRIIIVDEEQVDVRPLRAGLVHALPLQLGQPIEAGDIVARIDPGRLAPELDGIEREWQALLVKWMRDGANEALRDRLAQLRGERDRLRAELEEHVVRAPVAGTVSAIWVRSGSEVRAGDRLASLSPGRKRRFVVFVVLPAHALGHVRVGQTARASLAGFPQSFQDYRLTWIADQAVSSAEVKRYFGPERAGFLPFEGAVMLARADLADTHFFDAGVRRAYIPGMTGDALVFTRSERLLFALAPSLQRLGRFF